MFNNFSIRSRLISIISAMSILAIVLSAVGLFGILFFYIIHSIKWKSIVFYSHEIIRLCEKTRYGLSNRLESF